METETQAELLNAVVDGLLDRDSSQRLATILGQFDTPIDTSRPNIHDSKKEFLEELTTVEAVANHIKGVLDQLVGKSDKPAWIQVSSATVELNAAISAAMASAGVFHPSVFLGLPFRSQAMSLSQV